MNNYHKSVLLQETVDLLNIKPDKKYIDGTLGGGGHTTKILELGGIVLGLDMDQDALDYVEEKFKIQNSKFKVGEALVLVRGNFKDIDKIAGDNGFEIVSGILFDLGVSSHHFDEATRGFSVQKMGPLDMRMDRNLSVKAEDLVNGLTKGELQELFYRLGEERFAKAIADAIVNARKIKPIHTTLELVEIVRRSIGRYSQDSNPAIQIFQALRIAVNDELNSIREGLPKAVNLLEKDGRLAVISFHSLEDRIIKNSFLEFEQKGLGRIITKKPIVPGLEEIAANNRSRSAKLRVFQREG